MATTNELHVGTLFSLKDYVCVVTGGGTGIGLMASQALAANGAKVYITSRREGTLEKTANTHQPESEDDKTAKGEIIPIGNIDVRKKSDLESLVSQISAKEKYVSLLVAAAGVSGPKDSHPDTDDAQELKDELWNGQEPKEWSETFDTNVTSVYFSTVALLPLLKAAPREHFASTIVISSMSGMMRHSQSHFAYNASKAAAAHLSNMMSKEFSKAGVRVNSIAPGYFPSEMTMKKSDDRNKIDMPDEKVKDKGHEVPAGRSGTDQDMAMAVIFLTKCGYVNGQIVAVDGGVLNEVGS